MAFDGRAAAILKGGVHVCTTPNHNTLYQPPMGNMNVFLCSDCQYSDVHLVALATYFQFLATLAKNIQCRYLIDGPQHKQEQYALWQILIRSSAVPVSIGFISFGNRHAV